MSNMDEIYNIFSRLDYESDYIKAKASETCIKCKRPAGPFRDHSSKLEYQVSALCQECRDAYFQNEQPSIKEVA